MPEPILTIIGRLSFRYAKTMPHIPHEYTVRSPETEEDYVALWNAIETDGVFERYKRRRGRYLYPGDGRKYWHMGPLYQSRVINRMRIQDDIDRLREEGQLDVIERAVPLIDPLLPRLGRGAYPLLDLLLMIPAILFQRKFDGQNCQRHRTGFTDRLRST
jgi:hypothetical protein